MVKRWVICLTAHFVATFVDGHAAVIKMHGETQPHPRLSAYPQTSGDQRWDGNTSHSFWYCNIIRGPGWQLDTLPAPPLATKVFREFVAQLNVNLE